MTSTMILPSMDFSWVPHSAHFRRFGSMVLSQNPFVFSTTPENYRFLALECERLPAPHQLSSTLPQQTTEKKLPRYPTIKTPTNMLHYFRPYPQKQSTAGLPLLNTCRAPQSTYIVPKIRSISSSASTLLILASVCFAFWECLKGLHKLS